ncbi:hypothetical protein BDF19DRAFT_309750 [Syncephalis fuscata]|nr:hypothetical protein BDF19DRAFT_309750 [Syncephalis fuscata]
MLTSVDTPDPNADAEAIAGLGLYLDGASDGGPSDRPAFSQFTTDTTESIAEAGGVGGEGKDKIPGTNIVTEEMEAEGTANDDSEEFGLANPAKEGIRIIQIYGGTSDTPLRRADLIQSFLKVYQFVTSAEPTLIEYLHVTTQTATLCIPFSRNGQPFAALCLKTKLSPTSISRILNTASPLPATASPNTRPQFFVYRHSAHTLLSLLGGRNGSSMSGAYNNASVSTVSSMDTPTMSQTNSPRSYYIGESMMTNSGSYCLQYAASCAAHIIERYRHEIHAKNEVARALIVNRMFKAINSHMEPEQIIAATAKTICRAFKADRCMIIHFSQPDSSEQHPLGYITK